MVNYIIEVSFLTPVTALIKKLRCFEFVLSGNRHLSILSLEKSGRIGFKLKACSVDWSSRVWRGECTTLQAELASRLEILVIKCTVS